MCLKQINKPLIHNTPRWEKVKNEDILADLTCMRYDPNSFNALDSESKEVCVDANLAINVPVSVLVFGIFCSLLYCTRALIKSFKLWYSFFNK